MAEPGVGVGVGFEFPPRKVSWLKRDVLLFNLSIGCKADEPQFVYVSRASLYPFFHPTCEDQPSDVWKLDLQEGSSTFATFPTFPLGLGMSGPLKSPLSPYLAFANRLLIVFKLNTQEVIDFHATQGAVRIPGVPDLDPARLVDGDRTIQILRPLPVTSRGRDFEFRSRVLGVYDKGDGGATVLDIEDVLVDAVSGDVYARNIGCLFYVGQGGWGGPRGGPAQARKFPPPEGRAPDLMLELQVDEQAAHLYRYVVLAPPSLSRTRQQRSMLKGTCDG